MKTNKTRHIRLGKFASSIQKTSIAAGLAATLCLPAVSANSAVIEEILVYSNKRGAESLQDIPMAITAINADQIENSFARDLESLSYTIPNVALDKLGPPGFANFTIRGLGTNSSIPSLDPAVGTFIDGIYLGTNAGVIQDFINLESIEVLRGPQGVLQGKNVAGGAVMLRTRRPGQETAVRTKFAVNDFPGKLAAISVEGGLSDHLAASLTGYYSKDQGWAENVVFGGDDGEMKTWFVRPAFYYVNDGFDFYFTAESGKNEGDGPPQQGVQTVDAITSKKHVVASNTRCCTDTEWRSATLEANADVDFGEGKVTGLFGWRDTESQTITDVDALPIDGFVLDGNTDASQVSAELRYAGTFGSVDLTLGTYYFEQDLDYVEIRIFGGTTFTAFGGNVTTESVAAFANADWHLTEQLTLSAGIRWTEEDKSAKIAPQNLAESACDPETLVCTGFTFADDNTSTGATPQFSIQWKPSEDILIYGSWGEGLRSGGYNLRHTASDVDPRVTDDEELTNIEIGAKTKFADGAGIFNVAIFHTEIKDMLRDTVEFIDGAFVQLNQNAGDATVEGIEAELTYRFTDAFSMFASLGYQENEWDKIVLDISGDGVIDSTDYDLQLPRLAEWSRSIGFSYALPLSEGDVTFRGSYSYRDKAPYADNNSRFIPAAELVDASITWSPNDTWEVALFGKNLLDEELYTSITPAGSFGDIAYLKPPRQLGLEVRAEF